MSLRFARLPCGEWPGVDTGLPSQEAEGVRKGERPGLEKADLKFISYFIQEIRKSSRSMQVHFIGCSKAFFTAVAAT